MSTPLNFAELQSRLREIVGTSVSIQIVTGSEIPAQLEGRLDQLLGFRAEQSRGVMLNGSSGAWSVQIAQETFVSARASPIPGSSGHQQLHVRMHDHRIVIESGETASPMPAEWRTLAGRTDDLPHFVLAPLGSNARARHRASGLGSPAGGRRGRSARREARAAGRAGALRLVGQSAALYAMKTPRPCASRMA